MKNGLKTRRCSGKQFRCAPLPTVSLFVGAHCWIVPFSIIDGSGGLIVGGHCTLSVGVQIYTHDNVQHTLSSGQKPIERKPVVIGHNVYVGPNALITKGAPLVPIV
jgi:acetyltransferase-like isoleucine patch superfamily enzyme